MVYCIPSLNLSHRWWSTASCDRPRLLWLWTKFQRRFDPQLWQPQHFSMKFAISVRFTFTCRNEKSDFCRMHFYSTLKISYISVGWSILSPQLGNLWGNIGLKVGHLWKISYTLAWNKLQSEDSLPNWYGKGNCFPKCYLSGRLSLMHHCTDANVTFFELMNATHYDWASYCVHTLYNYHALPRIWSRNTNSIAWTPVSNIVMNPSIGAFEILNNT